MPFSVALRPRVGTAALASDEGPIFCVLVKMMEVLEATQTHCSLCRMR
jgi:hypothetical protein